MIRCVQRIDLGASTALLWLTDVRSCLVTRRLRRSSGVEPYALDVATQCWRYGAKTGSSRRRVQTAPSFLEPSSF
jgi:hypothetical protein